MVPGTFTKQPMKGLYTLIFIADKLVRLPLLMILYIIPSFRQHSRYGYTKAIIVKAFNWYLHDAGVVEVKVHRTLAPGREGNRFVTIKPSSEYPGILSQDPAIVPTNIGAVWYPDVPSAADLQKLVVLHIHGGAFLLGSARIADAGTGCNRLSKNFGNAPVFALDYRLANEPGGKFPAALQDSVTAYRYLLEDLNVDPRRIMVSGDSAGGHLAITLLRYIVETPAANLPSPAAALLWSPWVDMVDTFERPNTDKDLIPDALIQWSLRELPTETFPPEHPYMSTIRHPFKTVTPMWMCAGATERHYFRQVRFASKMTRIAENDVGFYGIPDLPHGFFPAPTNDIDLAYVDAQKFVSEYVEF
ncbi:alpha/beta-hydrolase [Pseudovirgaria hyperparasitica]|uniref:Alpha/beta-hydrolase n=1 Tax=Pseudovirgaria hyperparasitica TaxID=470096 RepID=A0A6A6W4P2_9PEZI|nr:alpha/beta-hydrolase [Pseudovirgaria hyperparasitica]KAF2757139.1 alpha/beta-hydrolase [Pseudovirgaria hyperparasitica]